MQYVRNTHPEAVTPQLEEQGSIESKIQIQHVLGSLPKH